MQAIILEQEMRQIH